MPERCGYARERHYLEENLRQLLFKSHRIVFRVDAESASVTVLYLRHGKQRAVGESEPDEAE